MTKGVKDYNKLGDELNKNGSLKDTIADDRLKIIISNNEKIQKSGKSLNKSNQSKSDEDLICRKCINTKKFMSKQTFKKHIQYCHQEKPRCPYCYVQIRADNMSRHIKRYCPYSISQEKTKDTYENLYMGITTKMSLNSNKKPLSTNSEKTKQKVVFTDDNLQVLFSKFPEISKVMEMIKDIPVSDSLKSLATIATSTDINMLYAEIEQIFSMKPEFILTDQYNTYLNGYPYQGTYYYKKPNITLLRHTSKSMEDLPLKSVMTPLDLI